MTYSRATAFHEAGHVVADCVLGHGVYEARVAPRGQHIDLEDDTRCVGFCESIMTFREHRYSMSLESLVPDTMAFPPEMKRTPAEQRARMRERGRRVMMILLAGSYAEARHRRRALTLLALGGSNRDWGQVEDIATYLAGDDYDELIEACLRETGALMRKHWRKVTAVADVLRAKGSIDGEHRVLRRIKQQPWPWVA